MAVILGLPRRSLLGFGRRGGRGLASRALARWHGSRPLRRADRHPFILHHIKFQTLQSERALEGHDLPSVLLGKLALPGLHLGVLDPLGDAPEPDRVRVELHPFGIPEVPRPGFHGLSVFPVAARAIHINIRFADEDLASFLDDLLIRPPPRRHVFVRIFSRRVRRCHDRPLASLAPCDRHTRSRQTYEEHHRPPRRVLHHDLTRSFLLTRLGSVPLAAAGPLDGPCRTREGPLTKRRFRPGPRPEAKAPPAQNARILPGGQPRTASPCPDSATRSDDPPTLIWLKLYLRSSLPLF